MAEVCFCKFLHFHKWQYKLIGNISAKQFACWLSSCSLLQQVAQLSQRDRTAGWVNYGQILNDRCDHNHNTLHNHLHNLALRNIWCHTSKT